MTGETWRYLRVGEGPCALPGNGGLSEHTGPNAVLPDARRSYDSLSADTGTPLRALTFLMNALRPKR